MLRRLHASGYRNDRAQELIKQGKLSSTTRGKPIYAEFAQLMNQEIPTIIVAYRSEIWGYQQPRARHGPADLQGLDGPTA